MTGEAVVTVGLLVLVSVLTGALVAMAAQVPDVAAVGVAGAVGTALLAGLLGARALHLWRRPPDGD